MPYSHARTYVKEHRQNDQSGPIRTWPESCNVDAHQRETIVRSNGSNQLHPLTK